MTDEMETGFSYTGAPDELEQRQGEISFFSSMIGGLHPFEEDWMLLQYIKGLRIELAEFIEESECTLK